jgi:hypothetical protein
LVSIKYEHTYVIRPFVIALSFLWLGTVWAEGTPAKATLVINGRTTEVAVVQIDGHSYVDVDAFARVMNAAVKFESGRVLLTVPAVVSGAKPERAAPGLSKEFSKAGIAQLAEMREWKAAIASVIRSGVAEGNWLGPLLHDHRLRSEASLGQTSLAAKTESDQKALQLLKNQFTSLGEWDDNTRASVHSLNAEPSINPAVAANDPLLAKISECGNFLNAMLVDGEFQDNPNCH